MRLLQNLAPRQILAGRTRQAIKLDLLRLRARLLHQHFRVRPSTNRLHVGCGFRHIDGWTNVDLIGSDYDVDLACGYLPWPDASFDSVVSQQVIEHLDLEHEVLPLFKELYRVSRPEAEIWLGCPDMDKICRAYLDDRGEGLFAGRVSRWPNFTLRGVPTQQMINVFFHQAGQHKNLYDFDLLKWALEKAGFTQVERRVEADMLERFPEFPVRDDDDCSIYVSAVRAK